MQAAEVAHLIDQLRGMVSAGPGVQLDVLNQVNALLARIRMAAPPTAYTAEKVAAVESGFMTWLSAGGGQEPGGAEEFRGMLQRDIDKLRHALARGSASQD